MEEFLVKRQESVLDILGRSRVKIVIDEATRTLIIQNSTYSCDEITVECTGKDGMHLKVGRETSSRKFVFESQKVRCIFVEKLKRCNREGTTHGEKQMAFDLFEGELILEIVQRITRLITMESRERAIEGFVAISNYRIAFSPYNRYWVFGAFSLPLASLETVHSDGMSIMLSCGDFRTVRIAACDPGIAAAVLSKIRPPREPEQLFAFQHKPKGESNSIIDGWSAYSPVAEYQRLSFLAEDCKQWRLVKNAEFRFSPTYPHLIVVPASLAEHELVQSASFRSKARLPVVVWKHPKLSTVLARSSQPNVGLRRHSCEADRRMVDEIRKSAGSATLVIVDARKSIASKGNQLKGKGVEIPRRYDGAKVEFMCIANIHKMRKSSFALRDFISTSEGNGKNYYKALEKTRWLKHIMAVLFAGSHVAELLHKQRNSVLVHCSDGWDRTPQLTAMAQLILDPYYRTIHGFMVLIEKEWCSFGHKFLDRIGVGKDANDSPRERSPIMIQWLDCVWQIANQFPNSFEFNQKFLLHIVDSLTNGLYGTFLYNFELERVTEKIQERTQSAWTPVLRHQAKFTNPNYTPELKPIYPHVNSKSIVLWDDLYFRWGHRCQHIEWNEVLHGNDQISLRDTIYNSRRLEDDDELQIDVDVEIKDTPISLCGSLSSEESSVEETINYKNKAATCNARNNAQREMESVVDPARLKQLLNESFVCER